MDNREFDRMLGRVLRTDLSKGTESFRDALLAQCLAQLNSDDEGIELADEDLELLAAAGEPFTHDPLGVIRGSGL